MIARQMWILIETLLILAGATASANIGDDVVPVPVTSAVGAREPAGAVWMPGASGHGAGSDYSDAASDPGPSSFNASYVQPPLSRHLAAVVVVGVSDPNLQYVGRWMAGSIAGTKRFDWGGTTIRMTITGTTSLGVAITVCAGGTCMRCDRSLFVCASLSEVRATRVQLEGVQHCHCQCYHCGSAASAGVSLP